jgi:hypothetical protein
LISGKEARIESTSVDQASGVAKTDSAFQVWDLSREERRGREDMEGFLLVWEMGRG